jgi:hypothetical protein
MYGGKIVSVTPREALLPYCHATRPGRATRSARGRIGARARRVPIASMSIIMLTKARRRLLGGGRERLNLDTFLRGVRRTI